jgi:copper chaperone CopZ
MKTLLFLLLMPVFALASDPANLAGNQTEKFKVYGNCGMCKTRIEKALTVKGVRYAVWDQETKILTVKFNPEVITLQELHQRCADVGHDTELMKAKDEVYQNLHGCCQYDRG